MATKAPRDSTRVWADLEDSPEGSVASGDTYGTDDEKIRFVYLGKTKAPSVKSFQPLYKKFSDDQLQWMADMYEAITAMPTCPEPHLAWACGRL